MTNNNPVTTTARRPTETLPVIEAASEKPLDQRLKLLKSKIDFYVQESAAMRAELSELRNKIEQAKTAAEKEQLLAEAEAKLADHKLENRVETQAEDPLLTEKLETGFAVLQHLQTNPTAKLDQLQATDFITDPALLAEVKKNPVLWAEIKSYAQTGSDVYAVIRSPECKIDDPKSWSAVGSATGRDLDKVGVDSALTWMKENKLATAAIITGGLAVAAWLWDRQSSDAENNESGSWWKWGLGSVAAVLGLGAAYESLEEGAKDRLWNFLGVSEEDREGAKKIVEGARDTISETAKSTLNYLKSMAPETAKGVEELVDGVGNLDLAQSKNGLNQIWEGAQKEGVQTALEITKDGSFNLIIQAADGAKNAYIFGWKVSQEYSAKLGEWLYEPEQPWWDPQNLGSFVVKADSYLLATGAAYGFTKSLFTTNVSLNPFKIAGGIYGISKETIKGATVGQYKLAKNTFMAFRYGKEFMQYQAALSQLSSLKVGETFGKYARWIKNPTNKKYANDIKRATYHARKASIYEELIKNARWLDDKTVNKLIEKFELAKSRAVQDFRKAKIVIGTEEIVHFGQKQEIAAQVARKESINKIGKGIVNAGKKTIEAVGKAMPRQIPRPRLATSKAGYLAVEAGDFTKAGIQTVGNFITGTGELIARVTPETIKTLGAGASRILSHKALGPLGVALDIYTVYEASEAFAKMREAQADATEAQGTLEQNELIEFLQAHPWTGEWQYANSTQQLLQKGKSLESIQSAFAFFALTGTKVKQSLEIHNGYVTRITLHGLKHLSIQQNTFVLEKPIPFTDMLKNLNSEQSSEKPWKQQHYSPRINH
jgi:hypothetical protein